MPKMTRLASTGGALLTLCGALFGCSARTDVSGTGSTPSQFTHVFITTQEVWFNTNSNATPDDSGWAKFTLKTPVTIDLVQQSNGTLGQIAGDLRLAAGTYGAILLMPLPNSAAVAASATALGATYNLEADYVDQSSTPHQVQLVLPNPEKGIVVPGATLKVPIGSNKGGLPLTGSTNTGTNKTSTTSTTTTTTSTASSANNTVTVSFATSFDANRDLHLFNFPAISATTGAISGVTKTPGAVLSANPSASDLSTSGGITGTLTMTSLTAINSVSERVAIQASAELLSSDGTHHVIVASAPVQTDGTFTIYPLPSNSKTPTVYDVVIHGPYIQTIIIKNVSVTTTTPSIAAAANTTGAVATTTATGAVSLGTFIPVVATNWFFVNAKPATSTPLPPGTAVTFYQTLQASGEVPYAIDEVGIDPFNQNLQTPEALANGNVESGVYASSGSTITVTSSAPAEGAGKYLVGATAPLFADAPLSSSNEASAASAPQTFTSSTAVPTASQVLTVSVPGLSAANSAGVGSITATLSQSSNAYNAGELLVSHNGAVIGSALLNSAALNNGAPVTVNNLPSGGGNYYLSVILWSAGNESGWTYQSIAAPVTVNAGGNTAVSATVP
jgi:hypothetical protein